MTKFNVVPLQIIRQLWVTGIQSREKTWYKELVEQIGARPASITSSKTTASLLLHNSILSASQESETFDKQNIAFLGKCHSISEAI